MVAHGRVVTSFPQITEFKQRRARLVLGWVTGARVTLPAMCRGVGQASHIMPSLSHIAVMGTWWNEQRRIVNGSNCRNALNYPQRRWDHKTEFQYQGCKLWSAELDGISDYKHSNPGPVNLGVHSTFVHVVLKPKISSLKWPKMFSWTMVQDGWSRLTVLLKFQPEPTQATLMKANELETSLSVD